MLAIYVSILCYILFILYFFFTFQKQGLSKGICYILSFAVSLPALHLRNALFLFEGQWILLSLCGRVFYHPVIKRAHTTYLFIPISFLLAASLTIYGIYNMSHIVRISYDVTSSVHLERSYNVALLADLHYPVSMKNGGLNTLITRLQNEKPDFVVLAGDIVDEYTTSEERAEVFQAFGSLTTQCPVFYVCGNHDAADYAAKDSLSVQSLYQEIEQNRIHVLSDEIYSFNEELTLVGRTDYRFQDRKTLPELLSNVDSSKYTMVFDHQPRDLEEANAYAVDLHLSGHTHAGQIFPMYAIYELFHINELNYGRKDFETMTAINTSGAAGWGFPVRTDHHSEYVMIHIHSK